MGGRSGWWVLVLALSSGCESKEELRQKELRAQVLQELGDGHLRLAATTFISANDDLDDAEKHRTKIDGLSAKDYRERLRQEVAAAVSAGFEKYRATELAEAGRTKRSDPKWVEGSDREVAKMVALLADPTLAPRLAALAVEVKKTEAETDGRADAAEAEGVAGKIVLYTEGFEDADLTRCARAAMEPILPGASWIERRGAPSEQVKKAAAGLVGLHVELEWSEYVKDGAYGNERPEARVPKSLSIVATPAFASKKKLPPAWRVNVGADNPDSISGDRSVGARQNALQLSLERTQSIFASACAELAKQVAATAR